MKTLLMLLSLLALILPPNFVTAQNIDTLPTAAYQEFKLPNGLRVIMHQDKSIPVAAINLWYHVGSKNDAPGKTGFAHLFEHLMFQGSKNYNASYFEPLQQIGATYVNGTTDCDRTNYFEVVPSNFLERAIFMEADRMGGLLDTITQEKLNKQRDVVKNERRQKVDNQPYGVAEEKISELLYPKDHPYHRSVIGSMEDLSGASLDDVKDFFRQYYVPNNATLVIAGDFESNQVKTWVEKYFGPIARGDDIKHMSPAQPTLNGEIRETFEDYVTLPRIYMVWHTVKRHSSDQAALQLLSSILTSGRNSRLQNKLMQSKQIAQTAIAFNSSFELGGKFQIVSTARSGISLDEIEKEINAEIERIKQEPPTVDEITRALNSIEASFIFDLQMVNVKSEMINNFANTTGNPDYFQIYIEQLRKVTPEDIQRVAKQYLNHNRVVISMVPSKNGIARSGGNGVSFTIGGTGSQAASDTVLSRMAGESKINSEGRKKKRDLYEANLPKPGAAIQFKLPLIEKTKLSNGLEVRLIRYNKLPVTSMNMTIKSGGTFDPEGKSGVASMTAALLDDGTSRRTAFEIANQLQSLGAGFSSGASWDGSGLSMQTLTKNLDQSLDIFADIITHPTFPEDEVIKYRARSLGSYAAVRLQPRVIADNVLSKILYGEHHPYGRMLQGNDASINAITRVDIDNFYRRHYRSNNAVLNISSNMDLETLTPKLEKTFADWKPGNVKPIEVPGAPETEKSAIYIVDKPGAVQSVIYIGQVGMPRNNPDYFPLLVMNSILGGQFSSRVNMNLREDKGYTYDAETGFSSRRGAGPFTASADVETAYTKEAITEFMKELRGIRGEIPVTLKELEYNKQSLIRSYPAGFETSSQISGKFVSLVVYDLPDSYFNTYIDNINSVTIQDINRVAKKYLDPDKMTIVVVGDRKSIEPKLRELMIPVMNVDTDGSPVNR